MGGGSNLRLREQSPLLKISPTQSNPKSLFTNSIFNLLDKKKDFFSIHQPNQAVMGKGGGAMPFPEY